MKVIILSLLIAFAATMSIATPGFAKESSARTEVELKPNALERLNEIDNVVSLTDEQYDAIAKIFHKRDKDAAKLFKNKDGIPADEFEAKKKDIYGGAHKAMTAVMSKEQNKLWREHSKG